MLVGSAVNGATWVVDPPTGRVVHRPANRAGSAVIGAATTANRPDMVLTGFGWTNWLSTDTWHFHRSVPVAAPGNLTDATYAAERQVHPDHHRRLPRHSRPAAGTVTVVDNATPHTVRNVAQVGVVPWSITYGHNTVAVPSVPAGNQPSVLQLIPLRLL